MKEQKLPKTGHEHMYFEGSMTRCGSKPTTRSDMKPLKDVVVEDPISKPNSNHEKGTDEI